VSLAAGTKLGLYEILAPLGAGGMGEVYRARDTKLGRDVAIKILPELFVSDPERVARFQREAQILASLNHPHIAAIYGLEEASSSTGQAATRFLVLEFVDGESLAQKLQQSVGADQRVGPVGGHAGPPLHVDEALRIAVQIVDALEAAHDKGIVHRDLKPANIMLTSDGVVKVLDFGLAKAFDPVGSPTANATVSPTLSIHATQAGIILGTAAYMSPEQARGKGVDKRADIWAFGCVLYEILTGRRPFGGEDISDTLAFVITKDPDWDQLPAGTPASIRKLLRRCLEKDRKRRLADIADARFEIEDALAAPLADERIASPASRANVPTAANRIVAWLIATVSLMVALVMLVLWAPWRAAPLRPPIRLEAGIGADASLTDQPPILSPDGALLAFVAQKGTENGQLYVRHVDRLEATALTGTENAQYPFFSPDGQWIAFFADGKLKKISVTGGAAVTLCDVPNGRGGSWAEDGTIVFQPNITGIGRGLSRVSAAGGPFQTLTTLLEGEANQRWPQMLPGGRAVLYTAAVSAANNSDANISVQSVPGGARKVLVRGGYFGRYLPSGHLVYLHDGTLFAVPFDLDRLELIGQAVPVVEHVAARTITGAADFAVSHSGTLVYVTGQILGNALPITWLGRDGRTAPLRATPSDWSNLRFSPDGRRLALDLSGPPQQDIWVYDWERDATSRLTLDTGGHLYPAWTPDGRRVVFNVQVGSAFNLFWQRADGAGAPERLTSSANSQYPGSWHPSGKFLAFTENRPQTGYDLMILPMDGDEASGWKPGKPTVFQNTPSIETDPMFSPDGHWIAYSSNETGRFEIFVTPFPGPGGKWQISTDGGIYPTWSRTRHDLFYLQLSDQRIVVASYGVEGDSFKADKPHVWSDVRLATRPRAIATTSGRNFDLHPDGDRFAVALAPQAQTEARQDKVVFIFNFFDELKRVAPVARR